MTKLQQNTEWRNLKNALFIFLLVFASTAKSAYFATLPKGVRAAVFHHLFTDRIQGTFDMDGSYAPIKIAADIDADSLLGIDASLDVALNDLRTNHPDEYAAFSLGKYEVDAQAQAHVNALGVGYGITDRLTAYVFTPHYSVDVNIAVNKVKSENYAALVAALGVDIENLPDIDARMIQSVIVNYYGYRPLGSWRGKGFGDTELGFMYRPVRGKRWGLLVTSGVVIPTGREDDPDLLQDFAFGDGQWDAFLEVGGGFEWKSIAFDVWGRYTRQFATTKIIRLPDSEDVPVTDRKGAAHVKYGDRFLANIQGHYILNSVFTLSVMHSTEYKFQDDYESDYPAADAYWESNTEVLTNSYKLTLETTTVKLFKREIFMVPLTLYFSYQRNYGGKNTPFYSRYDFEFRLFF